MKNTTKLKHILQLYTVSLNMDENENFILTLSEKRSGTMEEFTDKSYTVVVAKAFGYMKKRLKSFSTPTRSTFFEIALFCFFPKLLFFSLFPYKFLKYFGKVR